MRGSNLGSISDPPPGQHPPPGFSECRVVLGGGANWRKFHSKKRIRNSSVTRTFLWPSCAVCVTGKGSQTKKKSKEVSPFLDLGKAERCTFFPLFENKTVSESPFTCEKVVAVAKKPEKISPKCPTFRHLECYMDHTATKKVLLKQNPIFLGKATIVNDALLYCQMEISRIAPFTNQ